MSAQSTTSTAPKPILPGFLDWLKPRRSVAIARLRRNGLAMIAVLLITQLSPITPSPITCLWLLMTGGRDWNSSTRILCWTELTVFAILSFNLVQSYIGLKYPPPPCEPLVSPVKQAQLRSPPAFKPLKTNTPLKSSSSPFSASYRPSPVSTPSRVINYKLPLTPGSNSPFMNSHSSSIASPLAYRARASLSTVRPVDGNLLNQLEAEDEDVY